LFIPRFGTPPDCWQGGFNPSVGILFVHTGRLHPGAAGGRAFQSLGRDSVCSYRPSFHREGRKNAVSIPRSGFCLFIHAVGVPLEGWRYCFNPSVGILFVHTGPLPLPRDNVETVSIPRSGFCLFILLYWRIAEYVGSSFNPSVGILFVHTIREVSFSSDVEQFQSLGRDSVCSYGISGTG